MALLSCTVGGCTPEQRWCGTTLRQAYLSETDLTGSDLRGANLTRARMPDAALDGADLFEALLLPRVWAGSMGVGRVSVSDARGALLGEPAGERTRGVWDRIVADIAARIRVLDVGPVLQKLDQRFLSALLSALDPGEHCKPWLRSSPMAGFSASAPAHPATNNDVDNAEN